MNTVFCIQQKPIEIKPFKKQKIQITWYQLMMGQKEGCRFFLSKRQILCCVRTKRTKKNTSPKIFWRGCAPWKENYFSASILQVRSTKAWAAGESSVCGRAMPREIVWGGSIGSLTTLAVCPSVMRRFMILMPKPWAIIERAAWFSMVSYFTLGWMS